jgi:hypothetical protein
VLVGRSEVDSLGVEQPLGLDPVHERDDLGGEGFDIDVTPQLVAADALLEHRHQGLSDLPHPGAEVSEYGASFSDALATDDSVEAHQNRLIQ